MDVSTPPSERPKSSPGSIRRCTWHSIQSLLTDPRPEIVYLNYEDKENVATEQSDQENEEVIDVESSEEDEVQVIKVVEPSEKNPTSKSTSKETKKKTVRDIAVPKPRRRSKRVALECEDCKEMVPIFCRNRCKPCYLKSNCKEGTCQQCKQVRVLKTKKDPLCEACWKQKCKDNGVGNTITCSVCGEKKQHCSKGMCRPCYGSYSYQLPDRAQKNKCICKDCKKERRHEAKGRCHTCYVRYKHHQTIMNPAKWKKCNGCEKMEPIKALGFCGPCYYVHKRDNGLLPKRMKAKCIVCNEYKPIQAKNKCNTCYVRLFKREEIVKAKQRKLLEQRKEYRKSLNVSISEKRRSSLQSQQQKEEIDSEGEFFSRKKN